MTALYRTASARLLLSTALGLSLSYLAPGQLPFLVGRAQANPVGGVVSSGSAAITTQPNTVTINQQSDKAVIDWRGFDIGKGETTQFNQPSPTSSTLNRVNGGGASMIDGALKANGNVFLVNPNGVIIGSGARIDVGGLVATTAGISNANYNAGKYLFDQPSPNGSAVVQNAGTITVRDKGLAALVAPAVANTGTITANLGEVTLAGTKTFAIDTYGDGLLAFAVGSTSAVTERPKNPDGSAVDALVSNAGTIVANGGKVRLTANAAAGLLDTAVNSSGRIEARSVTTKNGVVILSGTGGGAVQVSGTIDATGTAAAASTGGTIKVLGETVALLDGARLDVSGNAGGGKALIGGNFHGAGPERNAKRTYVAPTASIKGDALLVGNGAQVAIWSDEVTQFFGSVSARGGSQGGNGGYLEVSSKASLSFAGLVDLTGPLGLNGTLLLDPANIELTSAANTGIVPPRHYADDAGNSEQIDPADVASALATSNVVLQATNTITVTNGLTSSSGNSLTLQGDTSITINSPITLTTGALILSSPQVTINTATSAIGSASNPVQIQQLVTNAGTTRTSTTLGLSTTDQNAYVNATDGDVVIGASGIQLDTGLLSLTAAGSISGVNTQSTPIIAGAVNLVASGTPSGNLGSVNIGASQISGTITGSSKGNFTLTNGSALTTVSATDLGALTVGGNLQITSVAPITNSGAVQISGTTSLQAYLAASDDSEVVTYSPTSITMGNAGNAFTGLVTLSGSNPGGTGPTLTAATVVSTKPLTTAASPITTNLVLTAPGIAQSGALTVGGTLTVSGQTGAVTLGNSANSFTGTVTVPSGAAVSIVNTGPTTLGTVTATSLALTSGGQISGSGAIVLSGGLALSAGSSGGAPDITLTSSGNQISGPISVSAARNVILTNTVASLLGPITITGAFSLTANGAVSSSGALQTGGNLLVLETASGADVTLDNAGNAISGTASLQGSGGGTIGNGTIVNSRALTLAANNVAGSFSAQAPSLAIPGTGSIAAGRNVTLTTDRLTLAGPVSGGGILTIQPLTPGTSIGVGDTASGALFLGSAGLAEIGTNFAGIVIGRANGNGAIDIESATFRNPVTIESPAAGGSIFVGGFLTGTGPASLTLIGSGGTTTLAGNLTTSGQAITINDKVLLARDVTLSSTANGQSNGAPITITGAIDAAPAATTSPTTTTSTTTTSVSTGSASSVNANRSLTITAGNGAVSIGAVGQSAPPVALAVSGGSITAAAATTAPGASALATGQSFVASTIALNGAFYLTNGGTFLASGRTTLGAAATAVDSRATRIANAAGGSITFTGQLTGASLTLAAGTGQANAGNVVLGSLATRDSRGSSNITGFIGGIGGIGAAPSVARPDGLSTAYVINGCEQGVSCLPVTSTGLALRSPPSAGFTTTPLETGAVTLISGPYAETLRGFDAFAPSRRLVPATLFSPVDRPPLYDPTLEFSSTGDKDLW